MWQKNRHFHATEKQASRKTGEKLNVLKLEGREKRRDGGMKSNKV